VIDHRKVWLIESFSEGTVLNVGCGGLKIPSALNLDLKRDHKPDLVADVSHLPFRSSVFSTAIAFDVIEHLDQPEKFLSEIERVSRTVVVECLNFDSTPENWKVDPTHRFYINNTTFRRLLRDYKIFELNKMLVAVKGRKIVVPKLHFKLWRIKKIASKSIHAK